MNFIDGTLIDPGMIELGIDWGLLFSGCVMVGLAMLIVILFVWLMYIIC
ncbi:MAG: hypothetical protein ACXADY_27135 [Candidatus Hodarchaeales archaeon]